MRASEAVVRAGRALGSTAEARTLLAHVLGIRPERLPLASVTDADADAVDALIAERLSGVPVQHLTGRAYFRTIDVAVGPGVFVPRPETEVMTGLAIDLLRRIAADGLGARPVVVELCAGSGAVSKALFAEVGGADQHAVELSDQAWPYLVANLSGTGVRVVHGDMADALPELDGRVDLIVVNPPYLPEGARESLPADVLHDPDLALFSGGDGLDALRVVVEVAGRLLRPGGWVFSEHDDSHGESAPALFTAAGGFVDVADRRDLAGRPRYVVARRQGGEPLAGWSA